MQQTSWLIISPLWLTLRQFLRLPQDYFKSIQDPWSLDSSLEKHSTEFEPQNLILYESDTCNQVIIITLLVILFPWLRRILSQCCRYTNHVLHSTKAYFIQPIKFNGSFSPNQIMRQSGDATPFQTWTHVQYACQYAFISQNISFICSQLNSLAFVSIVPTFRRLPFLPWLGYIKVH